MTACCEAENAAQALEGIMRTNPDLALTDFALPDKNGWNSSKISRRSRRSFRSWSSRCMRSLSTPNACCVPAPAATSRRKGASERLLRAIRHVLSGAIYVSDKMSARILEIFRVAAMQERSPVEELSDREFEVFELLGDGLNSADRYQAPFEREDRRCSPREDQREAQSQNDL